MSSKNLLMTVDNNTLANKRLVKTCMSYGNLKDIGKDLVHCSYNQIST